MTKKKTQVENQIEELAENEEFISERDDLDIEVRLGEDNSVMVRFTGFEDEEEADEYAQFLAENLPLLLFETTRLQ
jgi:hypothetical protein